MKKAKGIYQVVVKGESQSDWRAAVPEDIGTLIKGTEKDPAINTLKLEIIKKQVELLLNQGDTESAATAIEKFVNKEKAGYPAPVCRFKRDRQNGQCPYMGAHSFFGAFREAATIMFPEEFYENAKGKTKRPSKSHLRKVVLIKPHHVFFYRDGKKITEPDEEEGQQPVGMVKGFSYYETIRHPFNFEYRMQVNPTTKWFSGFLSDVEAMERIIIQSAWHGQGSCRSANYGLWDVKKIDFIV